MADDITVTPGTGKTIAADEVSSKLHQRVKISLGADGSATDMLGGSGSAAAGVIRTVTATDSPEVATLGSTSGAAVVTDASGTIQQYLRGLVKRWVDALGAGTAAAALRTTLASDDPAVAVLGATSDAAAATTTIKAALRGIATALGTTALDLGSGTGGSRTLRFIRDTAQWIGSSGAYSTATQRVVSASATHTDASVSSASGSSETVAASSSTRAYLMIANPATTTWWINPSGGTAAANGAGCFELPPGAVWVPRLAPVNAVTGIGTASSKLTVVTG